MNEPAGPVLTSTDLSRMLRISRAQVYRLLREGGIPPPIQLGKSVRWYRPHIETWLAARSDQAERAREAAPARRQPH